MVDFRETKWYISSHRGKLLCLAIKYSFNSKDKYCTLENILQPKDEFVLYKGIKEV